MDAVKDNLPDKRTDSDAIVENYEQLNDGVFPPRSTTESTDPLDTVRSSARPKVFTAKMKDYRQQLLERDFDAAQKACVKQVKRIQLVLVGKAEISDLQQERGKLEARMEDFADAHAAMPMQHEDEIKKLHMMKELAATQAELEAVIKIEEENYGDLGHVEERPSLKDNCSKDLLEKYLQSQINSILQVPVTSDLLPAPSTGSNVTSAPTLNVEAPTNVTFTGSSNLPRLHMSTSEEPPQRSQASSSLNPFASPFTIAISSHETPWKPVPDARLNSAISNPQFLLEWTLCKG